MAIKMDGFKVAEQVYPETTSNENPKDKTEGATSCSLQLGMAKKQENMLLKK